ncbi:transposase [Methylobacter sp.]|uniref:transposase n=1 Tax=Methylobacter sp. TaxID=2051955 RepID=UPI0012206615|nr:transposase [Methylobacter sp.]TAK59871.1 MAG: transposase [Methylobacter sp.]
MAIRYNQEFKDQAIEKTLQHGDKTIQYIADELNINLFTLKEWLRKSQPAMPPSSIPQRPGDWTPKQRLEALMQSAGLEGEHLNAFCREQGIFPHHLDAWKQAFINSNSSPSPTTDKSLRIELNQVKKELNRKEKALAEAAALLVLQKKCQAFWEEKE